LPTSPHINAYTLFEQVSAACATALAKTSSQCYYYQLAGYTIQLIFAGPALVPFLTPALDHLACPPVLQPHLTLYLWDEESTGVAAPRPWSDQEVELRGMVPTWCNDEILTAIQLDVNAVSTLNRRQGVGFYWIDSPASLRAYEQAAPLKVLLHWWLREHGLIMIHAGVVGNAEGAVLIVGKTGAGKSTTTLTCFNAGLTYLADDRCLLALDPVPQAYCVYNSAKLHLGQMERFPHLLAQVNNWEAAAAEKALIYLQHFAPQQLALSLPIRAILLANITGTPTTTLAPVARMAVLRDFVTSSVVYQPDAVQAEVHMMTELVRRLPCYQLNLGTNFAGIAPVIVEAIHDNSR